MVVVCQVGEIGKKKKEIQEGRKHFIHSALQVARKYMKVLTTRNTRF
jgi:hypothetical protein